jgi:hypothetical protein
MRVVDANCTPLPTFDEGEHVQLVDEVAWHGIRQVNVCLLECASDYLQLHPRSVLGCMTQEEIANVILELLVAVVRVQKSKPKNRCRRSTHQAWPIRGHFQCCFLLLGRPIAHSKDSIKFLASQGRHRGKRLGWQQGGHWHRHERRHEGWHKSEAHAAGCR